MNATFGTQSRVVSKLSFTVGVYCILVDSAGLRDIKATSDA